MNREEIVTNGCSGKCCEKFTFSYTQEELTRMIIAKKVGDHLWIDRNNMQRKVTQTSVEEMEKIKDMLIPLGETEIDPKTNKTFNQIHEDLGWKKENFKRESFTPNFILRDGNLSALIFTCRYFDKENKICLNYENRPLMCKNYSCKLDHCYEGCKNK